MAKFQSNQPSLPITETYTIIRMTCYKCCIKVICQENSIQFFLILSIQGSRFISMTVSDDKGEFVQLKGNGSGKQFEVGFIKLRFYKISLNTLI